MAIIAVLLTIFVMFLGFDIYLRVKSIETKEDKPVDLNQERKIEFWKQAMNHSVEDDLKAIKMRRIK